MRQLYAPLLCLCLLISGTSFAKSRNHGHSKRTYTRHVIRNITVGAVPCNDGTVSHAKHRQKACLHHGGIRH